jgi:hypothetical protein
MQIEEVTLERIQSLYESTVEFHLSDSSVQLYDLKSLGPAEPIEELLLVELRHEWTGSHPLSQIPRRLKRGDRRDTSRISESYVNDGVLSIYKSNLARSRDHR